MLSLAEKAFAHITRVRRERRTETRVAGVAVLSVGGLRVGGVGKSPLARALSEALSQRGISTVIAMRGYGGRDRGPHLVTALDDADRVGDEAVEHRRAGRPVIVSRDRVRAVALARAEGFRCAVLDDGFQHLALARDLDIVLVCADDLRARVLPAGPLREPRDALAHADLLVSFDPLLSTFDGRPVLHAARSLAGFVAARGRPYAIEDLRGARVQLVTAIARPERVADSLAAAGISVTHHAFLRDHRRIPPRLLRRDASADFVVVTAKDAARGALDDPGDDRRLVAVERVTLPETLCQQACTCAIQTV